MLPRMTSSAGAGRRWRGRPRRALTGTGAEVYYPLYVCSSPGKSIIFKLGISLSSDENAGCLELAGHLENKIPLNLNAPLNLNVPLNLLLGTSDHYHNSLQI